MEKIVTKEWLRDQLGRNPSLVIGRACVALQARQDADEDGVTLKANGRGFSKFDARIGKITADLFEAQRTLPTRILAGWLKQQNGFPRICRYANQLNEIAVANRDAKIRMAELHATGKLHLA